MFAFSIYFSARLAFSIYFWMLAVSIYFSMLAVSIYFSAMFAVSIYFSAMFAVSIYLSVFAFSLKNFTGSSGCLYYRRSKFNNLVSYVAVGSKYSNRLGTFVTRSYSTYCTSSLHPQFITGISDAESSFFITFIKSNKSLTGYYIQLEFKIGLHKKDRFLLELIKSYFGVGNIQIQSNDLISYKVSSNKDLAVIISHFNKYPLSTKKRADFELFKLAFKLINLKEHLNTKGFMKILSLKASLNKGLSSELESAFPNITPFLRPKMLTQPIKDSG